MTNSLIKMKMIKKESNLIVYEWEKGISAPKLTLSELANELHFHLRVYIRKKYGLTKIIVFLFFNLIQRILYTTGSIFGNKLISSYNI